MLVLVFHLGDDKYIVKHEKVKEISPMVMLKKIPHSPAYFAGLFNYRGLIVPVIDLCQLIQKRFCQMRLSTRIIIVESDLKNDAPEIFGFMAERVTDAIRKPENAFVSPSIKMPGASILGDFVMEQEKMIPCIDLNKLSNQMHQLHWVENHISHVSNAD